MRKGDEPDAGSDLTREERRRDPSRVLALTNGMYAIIITLLVRAKLPGCRYPTGCRPAGV